MRCSCLVYSTSAQHSYLARSAAPLRYAFASSKISAALIGPAGKHVHSLRCVHFCEVYVLEASDGYLLQRSKQIVAATTVDHHD